MSDDVWKVLITGVLTLLTAVITPLMAYLLAKTKESITQGQAVAAQVETVKTQVETVAIEAKAVAVETAEKFVSVEGGLNGKLDDLMGANIKAALEQGRNEGRMEVRAENAATARMASERQAGADAALVAAADAQKATALATATSKIADVTNGFSTIARPGGDAAAVVEAVDSLASDIRGDVHDTRAEVGEIHEATVPVDTPPE